MDQPEPHEEHPDDARLYVFRTSGWYARLRALRILVDGHEIGSVRHGEVRSLSVRPGPHVLQVKMDWVESRPVAFTCDPREQLDVRCTPPTLKLRERLFSSPLAQASQPYTVEVVRREG